ncbi:MAG TPA: hypothetical protein V6C69_16430 [Trichormus sp.]|jgi:hypothetical protein
MLRGFFVGALVGFAFGSSKKGNEIRQQLDGLLTDLMPKSNDEEDMSPPQESVHSKFGKEFRSNRTKERSGDGNGSGNSPDREDDKTMERGVPMDKAVELAEALNAKPTTPPTEELEPGEHAIGA